MARTSKQTNGIDPELASQFIARVENLNSDIDTAKAEYMNAAKAIREDITDVYAEAKDKGIPVKALKAMVKRRKLEKEKRALDAKLGPDEQTAYEQMVEKLGDLIDLPLGKAAMAKAGGEPSGDEAVH